MRGWLIAAIEWMTWLLASIPNWLPLALSLVATGVSVLAYRRSSPPILPKAWITYVGRGDKGVTVTLHVVNHTDYPIRLRNIRPVDRKLRIAPPPKLKSPNGRQFEEIDWRESLSLDSELPPYGSIDLGIALEITDASVIARPSMHLCISTMRRTIKNKAMVIPIIVPIAI